MRYLLHCRNPSLPVVLWLNQLHGLLMAQEAFDALNVWPKETEGWIKFVDLSWVLLRHDFDSLVRSTFTLAKGHYKVDKREQKQLASAQQELRKALNILYGTP